MWNNINNLTNLASSIQWIAIILVVLGAGLQGGKFFIDKRINYLKETTRIETEQNLNHQIDTLKKNADPYNHSIQVGVATVFVIVKSEENRSTTFMDTGGSLVFKQGENEMLSLSNDKSEAVTISPGKVRWKAVFNLDASHPNIGKKLSFLKDADHLIISFEAMEEDYDLIEGKAICTFNGNARLEFNIPKQKIKQKLIFVWDMSPTVNEVLK